MTFDTAIIQIADSISPIKAAWYGLLLETSKALKVLKLWSARRNIKINIVEVKSSIIYLMLKLLIY